MVLQNIVDGLIVGSILVLGAIGLTLIYGIRRFPNFAHGDIMTLGAYFGLVFNAGFATMLTLPGDLLWLALLLATAVSMALTAGVGIFLEISIFKRMHGESLVRPLIASIGLAFVLQNVIRIVWGTSNRNYGLQAQVATILPGGIRITDNGIAILGAAFALVVGVHLILKYTTLGKAMRATSDNWDLARVTGINVQKVIYATWIMGAGLAAAAGVLLGLWTIIRPIMGFQVLLPIFASVILGGIGSPYGAMAGGLLIGIAQETSVPLLTWLSALEVGGTRVFFDLGLQQPAAFKAAVSFILLVIVLLLLPQGISGLADKPQFKAFAGRLTARTRAALSSSVETLRRLFPWLK